MAHHEVVENNVKKELSYALIGILAFLGLVLLILISAIVRPAGNHVDVAKLNAEVEAKAAASAAAAAKPAGSTPAARRVKPPPPLPMQTPQQVQIPRLPAQTMPL